MEKAFSDKHCLRLAVQNCGKAIDEDVEITFEIPQKALLNLAEFPHFTNDEMGYLLNDCDMSILFGIDGTAEYIEYSESERNRTANYTPRPYGLPGYVPNYSDDFIDELNNVFCYSILLIFARPSCAIYRQNQKGAQLCSDHFQVTHREL